MSRVFVVGSINMDVTVTAERQPRPGETVPGSELGFTEGGKGANQAVAASRAGAETLMVGRLGGDEFGRRLEAFLDEEGVDVEHVANDPEIPTGTAVVMVAEAESTIVVVPGANGMLAPGDVRELPAGPGDVVVAQFEVPLQTVEAALERARDRQATTILNPAPARECTPRLLGLADVLVVNETELGFFVGDGASHADSTAAARELRAGERQVVVVTRGRAGALAIDADGLIEIEGRRVEAVDSTGAGDCFVGNLAAALSRGEPLRGTLETANVAASLCVQHAGAGVSMPSLDDVRAAV